jgi:hypothetical protein
MPTSARNSEEPLKPGPDENGLRNDETDGDTEGHSFMIDTETNRALARQREKDIQRNLKSESRRPFFRRGR